MTTCVLVRHTRPAVAEGTCYGRLDLDLAASAPADLCTALGGVPPVTRVYASPARRCRALAAALAARDGAPLVEDERLLEFDFGTWEGQPWAALERAAIDAWAADPWHYAPGGGETLAGVWARVEAFRRDLAGAAGRTAIVAHHGPLRILAAQFEGRDWRTLQAISLPFGGCLELAPGAIPGVAP